MLNANNARIFGITIKELKQSAIFQTRSTSARDPRNTQTAANTLHEMRNDGTIKEIVDSYTSNVMMEDGNE